MPSTTRRFSVSTWSLHRTLGRPSGYGPDTAPPVASSRPAAGLPLVELPAKLAAAGIHTLEICHFHLPSRELDYLVELRGALADARIELWSLLVDAGDIAHAEHSTRDLAWIADWFPVAQALGSQRVRVSGGRDDSEAGLARATAGLRRLADVAAAHGLRLMTENWHSTLSTPARVQSVLDALDGDLGLCVDFGNWSGAGKYDDLAAIMPAAESCHAKASFDSRGEMDEADYRRCLELTRAAGFSGPYTLIYDGPDDDEWRGLAREQEVVADYL